MARETPNGEVDALSFDGVAGVSSASAVVPNPLTDDAIAKIANATNLPIRVVICVIAIFLSADR